MFRPFVSILITCLVISTDFALGQNVDGIAAIVNDKVITFSEVKKQVEPTERLLRDSYTGQELIDKVKEARLNSLRALVERQLIVQNFNKTGSVAQLTRITRFSKSIQRVL